MNEDDAGSVRYLPLPSLDSTVSMAAEAVTAMSLKRRASSSFEGMQEDSSRKRMKEEPGDVISLPEHSQPTEGSTFANDLAQELHCGCCSELVYRPVLVMPCQHFFCGSCCVLWIRNGGTNCPACRGVSTVVTPFRALQGVIDTLLRALPHKARTERERQQADEVYKFGQSLRIPAPRELSPEPPISDNSDYARPCPYCLSGNPLGWRCPQPIPDPNTDSDHAWHMDDGVPPGHGQCGNCENILALLAPTTTKCDMCQVSFCGIGVQGRCVAAQVGSQHLHGMSELGDLIQSPAVYDCFDGNNVEVEFMLEYLTAQRLTPRHIYRQIVTHIQGQPRGFLPLIELDLFKDIHENVAAGLDPNPEAPRSRICRLCAAEVFLWGLKEWWVRERQKGYLEESVLSRKDCPDGNACNRQIDLAHAKEFNHIFASPEQPYAAGPAPVTPTPVPIEDFDDQPMPSFAPPEIATPPGHDISMSQPANEHDASGAGLIPITPVPVAMSFLLNVQSEIERSSSPDFRDAIDALS